jgi:TRAP-type C4-dicarboxylate transport system permease small subunit
MGWVILGAAAAGVREGFHMGFETLRDVLPPGLALVFNIVSDSVITIFGAAMAWYGGDLALTVWDATLPTLGLPGTVEYLPITLGGALMALFGLERLVAHLATGQAPAGVPAHTVLTDS